jgi:hypothetical protein
LTRSELDAIAVYNHLKKHGAKKSREIFEYLGITKSRLHNCKVYLKQCCNVEKLVWSLKTDAEPLDRIPDKVRESPTAVLIYQMMPVSQKGLAKKMGMHVGTIVRNLNLLKAHKLIHTEGWESSPTTLYPMWAAGYKRDTPRPTAQQLAREREKRYLEKHPEKITESAQRYRDKNKKILNEKQMPRYMAKRDEILTKAKLKRAGKPVKPAKPVVQAPATRWIGGNPFD